MTLKNWLKQHSDYKDDILDKEILIECPNGLLVEPEIKFKKKDPYGPLTIENIEALVIVP